MKTQAVQNHSGNHPRGFTLTEVLVVFVIIVVLAALSFSGFRRMRDAADKVTSTRNISQLQIANASYAADHNGDFVPLYANNDEGQRIGFWYQNQEFLQNLCGEVLDSSGKPVRAALRSSLDPKVVRARQSFYHSMAASYGMLDSGLVGVNGPNAAPCHNLSRVPNPSHSMAFSTSTDYRVTYNSRFKWKGVDSKTSDGAMAYRYNDKALVVYFDGHVDEVSQAELEEIDASKGGKNSSFWKPTAQ